MQKTHAPLSESERRSLLESIADALIFADTQGVIQFWNIGAESIFGYASSEAIGNSLDLIIPENLRAAHWRGYHHAISQGHTVHGRHSLITRSLHKSGSTLYVDISFSIVKNQAGETIGSAAIARDATQCYLDQKALRRQLAELMEKRPS